MLKKKAIVFSWHNKPCDEGESVLLKHLKKQ